jgi:hypothetical protein
MQYRYLYKCNLNVEWDIAVCALEMKTYRYVWANSRNIRYRY